jgi:serine/threonine-protein kinase HipA
MARKRSVQNVYLNSRLVGRLERATSGAISFQYDRDWLGWEYTMPISLSLLLREAPYLGAPAIAVFDNLMPDNPGIRQRLAEKTGAEGTDAYSMLAAVGRDCAGALQFLPDGVDPGKAGEVKGRKISEREIEGIIANLGASPLGVGADKEFRISLAGAHDKTALLLWRKAWMIPHGSTPTTHIFKPAIGKLPNGIDLSTSVENEYLCMKLCKAFGLPTAECEIATFGAKKVLVIERFDRRRTRDQRLLRVPQEDFCQALSVPSTLKYEPDGGPGLLKILSALHGSDDPQADQLQFLMSQVVFWLMAATDGHAKNFSLHISPGGRFRLAPLYDVLSAQPAFDDGAIKLNQMKLAMAVGDSRHYRVSTIQPRHFMETARKAGVNISALEAEVERLANNFETAIATVVNDLPEDFPENLALSVVSGIRRRMDKVFLAKKHPDLFPPSRTPFKIKGNSKKKSD